MNVSQTIHFIVDASQSVSPVPSLSPSPSPNLKPSSIPTQQPLISPSPSPTSKQQSGFLATNLPIDYGYVIVAISSVIVVGLGLAVYFRKRKAGRAS